MFSRFPRRLTGVLLALAALLLSPLPAAHADGSLDQRLERLEKLQRSIDERIEERRTLNAAAERGDRDVDEVAELREQAAALGTRIDELKVTFDGIATGVEPEKVGLSRDPCGFDVTLRSWQRAA